MATRRRLNFRPDDRRLWVGTIDSIPRGWEVDTLFHNRALVGAGSSYAPNQHFGSDSGSTNNHTLSAAQMPSHGHTISAQGVGSWGKYIGSTGGGNPSTHSTNATGSSQGHAHSMDKRQASVGVYVIKRKAR